MTKPNSQIAGLNANIARIEQGLQSLTDQRGDIYLQLQGAPGDKALMARLHDIDAKAERGRAEVEHLEGLRPRLAAADSIAERAEEMATVKELAATASGAAKQRSAEWAGIEADIASLGPRLQRVQDLTNVARRAAGQAAIISIGTAEFALRGDTLMHPANGDSGGVGEALCGVLLRAGVGIVGATIPGFRDMGHASRASVADASAIDAARLEAQLQTLVQKLEQAHYVKDSPGRSEAARRDARMKAMHAPGAINKAAEYRAVSIEKKA